MNFTTNDKYQTKTFGALLARENYYNQYHQIIRIKFNGCHFDFKFRGGGSEVPNPNRFAALVTTYEETVHPSRCISDDRLGRLPGIIDDQGNVSDNLPMGYVSLLALGQASASTSLNSGGSAFQIEKLEVGDLEKLVIALTPPTDKDYTSNETGKTESQVKEGYEEVKDSNVGLFINNDGAILIKSHGGSIALGEEGVYIAGQVAWESSEQQREWMFDNFLQRFVPSTIPTGAIAIPELPNIAKFKQIAEVGKKVRTVLEVGNAARKLVTQ